MNNNKTTGKDFDLFVKEGMHWLEKLGLKDWEVLFIHYANEELGDSAKTRANVEIDLVNHIATVGLCTDWSGCLKVNHFEVCKAAFHECCELLMADIGGCLDKFYSNEVVNNMRHKVIITLENTMFNDYYHYKKRR